MLSGEQLSYSLALYAEKTGFGPAVAIGPRARAKLKARDKEPQSWSSTVSGIQQHGTRGLRLKSPDLPVSLAL
jgi:hypothetical protein